MQAFFFKIADPARAAAPLDNSMIGEKCLNAPAVALFRAPVVAYAPAMDVKPDDTALMLRYADGDVAAFETLYRRHNDSLYRYLLRLSGHRSTAEDVFQETWGKIVKARSKYRPTAKFSTYLYRVAHNCFIDYLRRNKRHTNTADVDPDSQQSAGSQQSHHRI